MITNMISSTGRGDVDGAQDAVASGQGNEQKEKITVRLGPSGFVHRLAERRAPHNQA